MDSQTPNYSVTFSALNVILTPGGTVDTTLVLSISSSNKSYSFWISVIAFDADTGGGTYIEVHVG